MRDQKRRGEKKVEENRRHVKIDITEKKEVEIVEEKNEKRCAERIRFEKVRGGKRDEHTSG
jgi:hypothetical protein